MNEDKPKVSVDDSRNGELPLLLKGDIESSASGTLLDDKAPSFARLAKVAAIALPLTVVKSAMAEDEGDPGDPGDTGNTGDVTDCDPESVPT